MTSDKGYGDREEDIGLPEIFGYYDQSKESAAMVKVGLPSPLLDEWRGFDIKWNMQGKLQAQGAAFFYDQALDDRISIGASWLFMRVNSWQQFFFNEGNSTIKLTTPEMAELDLERRQMNQILGLSGPVARQSGMGDIDLFVRYGKVSEFAYKFRRMDIGIKLGALVPTGQKRNINEPASVPFGGNGHWGIYTMLEGEFELKEDLIGGFELWLSKRFAKTEQQRSIVSVSTQPQFVIENSLLYGEVTGPICINPGGTVMFSPYIAFENLRAGFCFRARYILAVHGEDEWTDLRSDAQKELAAIPVNTIGQRTEWASDYVSLTAYYDFGAMQVDPGMSPIVNLTWDLPALLFKAYNISKTNKISIGLELHF